jgi:FkbM family methyltransferase
MSKEIILIFKRWGLKEGFQVLGQLLKRVINKGSNRHMADENYRARGIENCGYSIRGKGNFWEVKNKDISILCRKYTSDLDVFVQIFIYDEFKTLIELIADKKIKISNIIDAGSNIGLSSVRLGKQFDNVNIISVEPDQLNFNVLQQNLKRNNISAHSLMAGVWSRSCRLYFDRSFRDGKEWSISLTEEPVSKTYIESLSFNEIISKFNFQQIDLLKIDIEGGERFIFNKDEVGLEFLDRTKVIAIEIHDEFQIKDIILETLIKRNFKIYQSGEYLIGCKEEDERLADFSPS